MSAPRLRTGKKHCVFPGRDGPYFLLPLLVSAGVNQIIRDSAELLECLLLPVRSRTPHMPHIRSRFIRHQFRPPRSVYYNPAKTGRVVARFQSSRILSRLYLASVTSSLTASRSLISSPSPSSWHYDTHSGRHPNKTSPSGSYSQTAPRSEHTPSPLKHPGSHHTPDAP